MKKRILALGVLGFTLLSCSRSGDTEINEIVNNNVVVDNTEGVVDVSISLKGVKITNNDGSVNEIEMVYDGNKLVEVKSYDYDVKITYDGDYIVSIEDVGDKGYPMYNFGYEQGRLVNFFADGIRYMMSYNGNDIVVSQEGQNEEGAKEYYIDTTMTLDKDLIKTLENSRYKTTFSYDDANSPLKNAIGFDAIRPIFFYLGMDSNIRGYADVFDNLLSFAMGNNIVSINGSKNLGGVGIEQWSDVEKTYIYTYNSDNYPTKIVSVGYSSSGEREETIYEFQY